jgi:hypothetical protein
LKKKNKKNRCVFISYGNLSSLWFPSPIRNRKIQISSFQSCFNTPKAVSTHLLHSTHMSLIISRKEGIEREQGRVLSSHLKAWAGPQVLSTSEGRQL